MRKMKIQLNKQLLFNALFALMVMLVFVRYGLQIDYPRAVLLIISAIMVLIGNPTQILSVCMICIPLSAAFHYLYALLIAIVMYVLKNEGKIRINATIIPILMLIVWELLHGITGNFAPKDFVTMFLPYLLCGLLLWQDEKSIKSLDYAYIVRVYAIATCAVCLTLIFSVLKSTNYDLSKAFIGLQRLGEVEEDSKQSGIIFNPNSLGIMCIIAACGLLQLMTAGQKNKQDVYLVIILLIAGMLTVSRTFLTLLFIMVVLFGFSARSSRRERMQFLIRIAIIAGLVIALAYWLFPGVYESFADRLSVSDLSGGRNHLFEVYNNLIFSNPKILLFGIGLTGYEFRASQFGNVSHVPHNGLQEIILAWGIIGLAIFLAFCTCLLMKGKKIGGNKTLINYIPFVLWFAKIQAGQMVTSDYTMLLFTFCFLSVLNDFNTKNQ